MASRHDHVLDELRERLRALGLRATSTRLAVLHELHEHGGPMSHEELMRCDAVATLDRATVYRLLSDLTDAGLVRRMDLGDHVWRYELDDDCRDVGHDHAHFLCESCGEVKCLPPLVLRTPAGEVPAAMVGAEVRLKVSGRCARCVAA